MALTGHHGADEQEHTGHNQLVLQGFGGRSRGQHGTTHHPRSSPPRDGSQHAQKVTPQNGRGIRRANLTAPKKSWRCRRTPRQCPTTAIAPIGSAGSRQCRPSAAKMGAVYKNTTMCEALVWRRPSATNKNSRANNTPTASPGKSVPSRKDMRSPRTVHDQRHQTRGDAGAQADLHGRSHVCRRGFQGHLLHAPGCAQHHHHHDGLPIDCLALFHNIPN